MASTRYSSYFLLFLQYGEAVGMNLGFGIFGMVFPGTFLTQLCPKFRHSDVNDHPVPHMITRMFW